MIDQQPSRLHRPGNAAPLFVVTLDYQTVSGFWSSARFQIHADGEDSARAIAEGRLAHDRRRKVRAIFAGTVERAQ